MLCFVFFPFPRAKKEEKAAKEERERKEEAEERRGFEKENKKKTEQKGKEKTHPGGEPISFETVCLSMNSDMSSLTIASSDPK